MDLFQIIHIDSASAKASSSLYRRKDVPDLIGIELSIQDSTEVTFRGRYTNEQVDLEEPIEISFDDIPLTTGTICKFF